MANEYRERVSVKKEILSKIQTLIQFVCYEQSIEVLDDLMDDNLRRKDRNKKQSLYFAAKNATTKEEKEKAWKDYYFRKNSIFLFRFL